MIDFILNIFGLEKKTINQNKELYLLYKFIILIILLFNIIYNTIYYKKEYIGFIIFKYNYIIQYIILNINLNKLENNNNFDIILTYCQLLIILKVSFILYFNIIILDIKNILLNIGEFIGS